MIDKYFNKNDVCKMYDAERSDLNGEHLEQYKYCNRKVIDNVITYK